MMKKITVAAFVTVVCVDQLEINCVGFGFLKWAAGKMHVGCFVSVQAHKRTVHG